MFTLKIQGANDAQILIVALNDIAQRGDIQSSYFILLLGILLLPLKHKSPT